MSNEIKITIKVDKNDYNEIYKRYTVKMINTNYQNFYFQKEIEYYINGVKYAENSEYLDFQEGGIYNVTIKFKVKVNNCRGLFSNLDSLIHIDLSLFDAQEITDMSEIFSGSKNLKTVNFSNFKSSKVTNMSKMFYGCINLKEIKFSYLNAENVTNMSEMFSHCGMKNIKFPTLNSMKLENMSGMFSNCQNLKNIDFSSFYTENATDMSYLFQGCENLENINFSNLNTKNVVTMEGMFNETDLKNINLSTLNTKNVKNFSYFFSNCKNLDNNHLCCLKNNNADNMNHFFEGCDLNNINLCLLDTQNAINLDYFFCRCKNITINEKSFLNLRNCSSMSHMFYQSDLSKVNFSFLDSKNVENIEYFLAESENIAINENSIFNAKNCIWGKYMFYKTNLSNVNFSFLDIRNVENMEYCFSECQNITIDNNSILNLKNCTNMNYTFSKTDLNNVNFSFLYIDNVKSMEYCFYECTNITINEKSKLKANNCINMNYTFYKLDLSKVNFSFLEIKNIENMKYCFSECQNLIIDDKSILNLKSCIDMNYTFYKTDLKNVNFSFLLLDSVKNMDYCFYECKNIIINDKSILKAKNCINMNYTFYKTDLSKVNFSFLKVKNIENMEYCFCECNNITINENSILKLNKCNNMNYTFYKNDLKNVNFSFLYINNVKNMNYCFSECENINIDDKSILNINNCINMDHTFYKTDLKYVNFSFLYIDNVQSMNYCFSECENITINDKSILKPKNCIEMNFTFSNTDLKNVNFLFLYTTNVQSMKSCFFGCKGIHINDKSFFDQKNLLYIDKIFSHSDLSNINFLYFNTNNNEDMSNFFSGCQNIKNEHLSSINTNNTIYMNCMFENCDLTNINISLLYTKNVKYMRGMFSNCNLTNTNFSSFDTSNAINMEGMFSYSQSETNIDFSNFDTQKVTSMNHMFYECKLASIDISSFNMTNIENIGLMFKNAYCTSIALPPFYNSKKIKMDQLLMGCDSLIEIKIWRTPNENYNNLIVQKSKIKCKTIFLGENNNSNNANNNNFEDNINMNNYQQFNNNVNNFNMNMNNSMNLNQFQNNQFNNIYMNNNLGMNNNMFFPNNMPMNFNFQQNMNMNNINPFLFNNNNFNNQNY